MRLGNPLRDEAAAFRVVFVTLGAVGVLVLASWIATALGLVVLAVEVGALAWLTRRALHERSRRRAAQRAAAPQADVADTRPPADAPSAR